MHLLQLLVRRTFRRDFTHCARLRSLPIIQEDDIVLLKRDSYLKSAAVLTEPLQHGKKIKLDEKRSFIPADQVIGKQVRDVVNGKRLSYRILLPTLAEYTDLSPRIVTPIYSQDAGLIVSLLDLNPSKPGESAEKLEIFEAGTGHGALTLHLARAIHGANPAIPGDAAGYEDWTANRQAVIHTLDISQKHSDHAQITVKNFKKGIYFHNVEFHVGSIDEYLLTRSQKPSDPDFDHAILDLPDTHKYIEAVGSVLKLNGLLITFCPSITQINACLRLVKSQKLPFHLEKVLEIGSANGVGGREWDVRLVKPRTASGKVPEKVVASEVSEENAQDADSDLEEPRGVFEDVLDPSSEDVSENENPKASTRWESDLEMVCRPKVGVRIAGGGFLGVWRKKCTK